MSFWEKLTGGRKSRTAETTTALKETKSTGNVYSLNVNFDLPVEEMVKRGSYRYVESGTASTAFTAANYPPPQTGAVNLQMHLMPFQGISIKEALNKLDSTKHRPAALHELLALGEQYPDLQRRFSILAPGTRIEPHPGYISIPRLAVGGLGRLLDVQPISHDMNGQQCMLAAIPI
jgi:hypothetical protein